MTPDLTGNILVVRLAADTGDVEWARDWGGGGQDRPSAVAVSGADLYVAGETSSMPANFDGPEINASTGDAFIVRADVDNGRVARVKHLDGNFEVRAIAVRASRLAVAGEFRGAATLDLGCSIASSGAQASDGFVAELRDSNLDCRWVQDFGDSTANMGVFMGGVAAHRLHSVPTPSAEPTTCS